jgi:hypothetical protein
VNASLANEVEVELVRVPVQVVEQHLARDTIEAMGVVSSTFTCD